MTNRIDLNIKKNEETDFFEINAVSKDNSFINFDFFAKSLTEIDKTLQEFCQKGTLLNNSEFFIEDELFATNKEDGLLINKDFSQEIADKYATYRFIDFTSEYDKTTYYDLDTDEGIVIKRNDGQPAYTSGRFSGTARIRNKHAQQYIHFKDEERALKSLDYHLLEDPARGNIDPLDKTIITVNGEKYKALLLDKEIDFEFPRADNKFNLSIEIEEQNGRKTLSVTSDKQIYDAWLDPEPTEFDFKIEADSLTGLYDSLYNATQSNDCIPNDAKFYVDGELFAEMVEGFHLAITKELKDEVFDKYRTSKTIDFITSDTYKPVYGEPRKVDGLTLYRNDNIRAYTGYDTDNYILDADCSNEHKDEAAAKAVIDYYIQEEVNAYDIKFLDKTVTTFNGEPYKTFKMNKVAEDNQEIKKKNKSKRKLS